LKDLRNSEQKLELSIYTLKVQLEQSEQATKEQIDQLVERVVTSEEMLKQQEGIIDDLESKSQLYAEEIQRSRESEESFRKAVSDQMEAHFEQTAKRAALLEAQSAERVMGIEMMMVERMKESEKKMKRLKEDNEYQEEVIVRLEKVIPALMQEMQELRQYAQDFETRLAAVTRVKEESSPFLFSKVRRSSVAR
jgi:chromosome segregation ATPase